MPLTMKAISAGAGARSARVTITSDAGRVGPLYSHRVYREYGAAPYAYYGGPAYYSPYYYSYGYGPPLIGGPGIGFSIGID